MYPFREGFVRQHSKPLLFGSSQPPKELPTSRCIVAQLATLCLIGNFLWGVDLSHKSWLPGDWDLGIVLGNSGQSDDSGLIYYTNCPMSLQIFPGPSYHRTSQKGNRGDCLIHNFADRCLKTCE